MLMIGIGSILVGAVFALRFTVLALIPLFLLFILSAIAALSFGVITAKTALWAVSVGVIASQSGYVCGMFVRYFLVVSRIPAAAESSSSTARV